MRKPCQSQVLQIDKHAPLSWSVRLDTPQSLQFTLPLPPSINHQYATVRGRRVLSAEGRRYKATVGWFFTTALKPDYPKNRFLQGIARIPLSLTLHFFFSSAYRRDLDGGVKILQDSIAKALNFNDAQIFHLDIYKEVGHSPLVHGKLTPLGKAPSQRWLLATYPAPSFEIVPELPREALP